MNNKMKRIIGWVLLCIIFGIISITLIGLKMVLIGLGSLALIGLILWLVELTQTPD